MRNMKGVILGSILLIALGFSFTSQACTPDGWTSFSMVGNAENGETGSPVPVGSIARYSEFCGYKVTDTSYVQSDHASDTRYFGRFYVFVDVTGAGSVDLLVAYSDTGATTPLFTISYTGTNIVFDAVGAGGGSGSATALSGWNCIEFEYDADSDTFNIWVNEPWDYDTLMYTKQTDTFSLTGDLAVEVVRLGAPNGMDGFSGAITYDAFESRRTSNAGALINCDANGSGDPDININDILAVINERFGNPRELAIGQPDCDNSGGDEININDILAVIEAAFPSA